MFLETFAIEANATQFSQMNKVQYSPQFVLFSIRQIPHSTFECDEDAQSPSAESVPAFLSITQPVNPSPTIRSEPVKFMVSSSVFMVLFASISVTPLIVRINMFSVMLNCNATSFNVIFTLMSISPDVAPLVQVMLTKETDSLAESRKKSPPLPLCWRMFPPRQVRNENPALERSKVLLMDADAEPSKYAVVFLEALSQV